MWDQKHIWNSGIQKSPHFLSSSFSDDEASPRARTQLQISRIQNNARKRSRAVKKK
jgi:hypothetical protein